MKRWYVCGLVFMVSGVLAATSMTYLDYAKLLADEGIIVKRSTNDAYRVGDKVWRQEVIGMAVNMHPDIDLEQHRCTGVYNDITTTTPNTWVCRAAEAAATYGILTRGEQYPLERIGVKPERNITRSEALAMIWDALDMERATDSLTLKYSFSSDTVAWQKRLLAAAYEQGVISNTETFGPNTDATRGEIFEIIAKLKGLVPLDTETISTPDDELDPDLQAILEELGILEGQ